MFTPLQDVMIYDAEDQQAVEAAKNIMDSDREKTISYNEPVFWTIIIMVLISIGK